MHFLHKTKKSGPFYRLLLYSHCFQTDTAVRALQNYEHLNNRVNVQLECTFNNCSQTPYQNCAAFNSPTDHPCTEFKPGGLSHGACSKPR